MSEVLFTGLDGKNPLGFLAALGALNAAADRARDGHPQPKLAWRSVGTYRPVLVDGPSQDELLDVLRADLESCANEPAMQLRYAKGGTGPEAHDLKPPPEDFVRYLRALVASAGRRSLALAAAFATDVAVDNNGNTKPTALHFTAGQQEFLAMVDELRRGVTREDSKRRSSGLGGMREPCPFSSGTIRNRAAMRFEQTTRQRRRSWAFRARIGSRFAACPSFASHPWATASLRPDAVADGSRVSFDGPSGRFP